MYLSLRPYFVVEADPWTIALGLSSFLPDNPLARPVQSLVPFLTLFFPGGLVTGAALLVFAR